MAKQFRAPLAEQYRPRTWADVVGQDKAIARIRALADRAGLTGRAFFLSGSSGTGKTTIGRLIAAEVASDWDTEELDAGALTVASLREIERGLSYRGMGEKGGRAVIVNEAPRAPQGRYPPAAGIPRAHPGPCGLGVHFDHGGDGNPL